MNFKQPLNKITTKQCILLLDAMDENPLAQDSNGLKQFNENLNKICQDFAFVIITCRPQFFPDDKSISSQINVHKGEHWLNYTRLKLSEFDDDQVHEYLNKVFSPAENNLLLKAEEITNKHPLITIRPLILEHIRPIVESNREINTTLDIYDTIVQSWIHRELEKTSPDNLDKRTQQWWNKTSQIASYLYQKTIGTSKELSLEIEELTNIFPNQSKNELTDFLSNTSNDLSQKNQDEIHFLQRSMLTRTGDKFHFSHKSFYEYFMAYRFFLNYGEIEQVYGMDFAIELFDELYKAYCNKRPVLFADLQSITKENVAKSLFNIGCELQKINHFTQAEPKYNEALKTYRQLAKDNPDTYNPYLASVLENLAILHSDTNRHQEAEEKYDEALNIRRQLAEKNPDAYLPYVAITLNNLGELHRVTNRHKEAEEEYNEALKIRRQLADKNPDAYLPDVASSLNNFGALYNETKQYDKADEKYNEALTIRRQLAEKNPDAFMPDVADTVENMANNHRRLNRHQEAEEEYNEALKIRRQLADRNPDAYLHKVAQTLYNIASLRLAQGNLPAAEEAAQESLEKYRIMAEKSHAAFDKDVKDAEFLLKHIRTMKEATK